MEFESRVPGIEEAAGAFLLEGDPFICRPYGSGHINTTFRVSCRLGDGSHRHYILQQMNKNVFTKPDQLMENVVGVTTFLRKKIIEQGGDPDRETLNIIKTKAGKNYFVDCLDGYWRVYQFIEDAFSYDLVEKPDDFYQSALAFGNFQHLLADYPAATLHETIEGFHDTAARFEAFKKAAAADVMGRAAGVQEEIRFVMENEIYTHVLGDLLAKKELPLRVTHNDTKLNNVMIDKATGKGLCVIDLDTVMPGLSVNDFGDSIRFGASTALEDEQDLSKVSCSMELFEVYTKGFMEGCRGSLTEKETEMLPMGALVMTLECGMRFLTDYLSGDTYFKIHREKHNLDRDRTQFKLVSDMKEKWETMKEIVAKCR